jgi:hypothetical protein
MIEIKTKIKFNFIWLSPDLEVTGSLLQLFVGQHVPATIQKTSKMNGYSATILSTVGPLPCANVIF